ncbi:SpoIIE family protein phosphatase [Aurantivibrio infirmus]
MEAYIRKLLIIDDDTAVRQNVAAYLEDSGYLIKEADSGLAGLALFDSFQPELVLSDLMMPDVSGLEVLKKITAKAPEVPVIVISGVGVMDDVVEALRLGASDYLIKPIADMKVIEHAIKQGLEHKDLVAENRRYRDELEKSNSELLKTLQLFERDQKAGHQVQERLLPPTPVSRGGYTISRYINPSLYLSGDFIDYAYFLNQYLGFYLVDVSGHGASSAFVTIWLKFLVRQLLRDRSIFFDGDEKFVFTEAPNLLLQGINRELIATRLENHLTSFQGTIDCKTHKMRYAVGGHLPMPILRTEEGAEFLKGKGKPLGLFHDIEWEVYEISLPEKCVMVMFSDGIFEILPGNEIEEKETLLLDRVSHMEGEMTIENLCRCLGIEANSDYPDDIAVLMVTRGH